MGGDVPLSYKFSRILHEYADLSISKVCSIRQNPFDTPYRSSYTLDAKSNVMYS